MARHRRRYRTGPRFVLSARRLAAGALLLAIVAAVPLYGYVKSFVAPSMQEIIRVGDVAYTVGDLLGLLRLQGHQAQETAGVFYVDTDPFALAERLGENETARQTAPQQGITVSDADIEKELHRRILGPAVADDASLSRTEIESEFRERYRQFLTGHEISDRLYRRMVEHDLYRAAIMESLGRAGGDIDAAWRAWIQKQEQKVNLRRGFNSEIYAWIRRQMESQR
jgi:hypothetical protein